MPRTVRTAFTLTLFLTVSYPAAAAWRVAESANFTVYSEAPEAELRETTERLEKFDKILRVFSSTTKPPAKLKLTLYQLPNMEAVAALAGPGVGGFYTTSIRGPYLVATRKGSTNEGSARRTVVDNAKGWGPEVMQHEYVHHFMYQYFPGNYPSWYSEGFAEYYGTLAWQEGNVIELGHAPYYRMDVIKADWLPMKDMLTAKNYAAVGDKIGSLYAQGWLLTHMASQNPERGRQLKAYLTAVASGTPYGEAAKTHFGDLTVLDKELKAHAKKLNALRLPLRSLEAGPVNIRELSEAEAEFVRADIKLHTGMLKTDTNRLARQIDAALKQAPNNVQGWEMAVEAHRLDNNLPAAKAAIAKLQALDPKNGLARFHMAQMELDALKAAGVTDEEKWDAARASLVEASRLRPNTPRILEGFYDSYVMQGRLPPAEAQNALMTAHLLLPRNSDLRYKVAGDFERRQMYEEAIAVISPEAYGTVEGDPKDAEKRRKQSEKWASQLTGYKHKEPATEFLARLEKKKADADAANKK